MTDDKMMFAGSKCQTVILPAVPVAGFRFVIETDEPVTLVDQGHECVVQPFTITAAPE